MGHNDSKFEEALYLNGTDECPYSLDKIAEMYKSEPAYFENEIRPFLYCPECRKPKLKFNPGSSRQRHYLSSVGEHSGNCSCQCPPVRTSILKRIDETPDLDNLQARLESCLRQLLKGRQTEKNPCIFYSENDPFPLKDKKGNRIKVAKNSYIPKKRLTHAINQNLFRVFMMFYGQVELEWHETQGEDRANDWYPHKLHVFYGGTEHPICLLKFSDNVYAHLPDGIRKYDKEEKRFTALTAFYAKLEDNAGPAADLQGRAPCKTVINDSRKITFLDAVQIQ